MGEATVRIMDLPESVGAVTSEDETGHYNVYVNARWGYAGQQKALRHEMEHIRRDDWHSDLPLSQIEAEVRKAVRE